MLFPRCLLILLFVCGLVGATSKTDCSVRLVHFVDSTSQAISLTLSSTSATETITNVLPRHASSYDSFQATTWNYSIALANNPKSVASGSFVCAGAHSYSFVLVEGVTDNSFRALLLNDNRTRPDEYPLDNAKVRVVNATSFDPSLIVTGISENCYKCLKLPLDTFALASETQPNTYSLDTTFPFNFVFQQETPFTFHFGDRGVYTILAKQSNNNSNNSQHEAKVSILVVQDREPYNIWIPIGVAIAIYATAAILWVIAVTVYQKRQERKAKQSLDSETPLLIPENGSKKEAKARPSSRIESLDAFRGTCIGVMIFVNYGGGGYWFFDHSTWNGLTWADLVFPWFIFIMGTAMPLSFASLEAKRVSKWDTLLKVIKRSIMLFGLGLFLNNGYDTSNWRILGVLQRFGVSYLAVSLILLFVPKFYKRTHHNDDHGGAPHSIQGANAKSQQHAAYGIVSDLVPFWMEWVVVLMLLTVWLLVTFLLPVPGCPRGYLGAGGLADDGKYWNCTGGAAGYVDYKIFGPHHIYSSPTCRELYMTGAYDPEGTLGYLTSIVLCYLGAQSGRILVFYRDHKQRILRWAVWSVLIGALGTALCFGAKNGGVIPVNKNMWSASFIFVMAGTGYGMLAVYYLIIDVLHLWNGAPFKYIGMNPILIYCCHEILQGYFPFSMQVAQTHAAQLAQNLFGVTCWFIVAFRMYMLGFFVSL